MQVPSSYPGPLRPADEVLIQMGLMPTPHGLLADSPSYVPLGSLRLIPDDSPDPVLQYYAIHEAMGLSASDLALYVASAAVMCATSPRITSADSSQAKDFSDWLASGRRKVLLHASTRDLQALEDAGGYAIRGDASRGHDPVSIMVVALPPMRLSSAARLVRGLRRYGVD